MSASCEKACPVGRNCCRLPLLLGIVLLAILAFRGFGPQGPEIEKRSDSPSSTGPALPANSIEQVSLSLDFGDGQQEEFSSIPWRSGMTIADLFHEVPGVSISQKGTGKIAFLTGINGIENQGADGRNWIYEVNGQSGDRSFADYELYAGDSVLWTFRASR